MSEVIEGFTQDHFGFYLDEKPFDPKIALSQSVLKQAHNVCKIYVDLSMNSTLDVEKQRKLAETLAAEGTYILWDLDFKLLQSGVNLHFEGHFNILNRALTHFIEQLLDPYRTNTFGVCFFSGSLFDIDHLYFDRGFESYFHEWSQDLCLDLSSSVEYANHLKRLYKTVVLSEYIHKFSSRIFDLAIPFVEIDVALEHNLANLYQILSKFDPMKLILANHSIPIADLSVDLKEGCFNADKAKPDVGLCFPDESVCSESALKKLNSIIQKLNEKQIPYRIFPESEGMNYWDQLEKIIVISDLLSVQGMRVIQGFCAAMGQVIFSGIPLNTYGEISFEDFISTN